ncbi:MAG: hypothetical protein K2N23_08110 [Clostridia bacterium]|nr:hypothetical protein [Clostridia bacterium]
MKIGIIDIGSNSVRLALSADGKTLYKRIKTTRLGEGLSLTGKITSSAIERTASAVADFKAAAELDGAEKVYVFATAAARSASNGNDFVEYTKNRYGIEVDVISGETEAQIGLLGALGTADGGIIDLGGASCEVTVRENGKTVYTKSVDAGAVRLLDTCGRDRDKLEKYISEKLSDYGSFDAGKYNMYGVSGTATTLAAVKHKLTEYDPKIVHGTPLSAQEVGDLAEKFLNMSVEQIKQLGEVIVWRADVIAGASLFLYRLMQYMNISKMTVSENDNLEGYLIYRNNK